jgi:hypothetical protein
MPYWVPELMRLQNMERAEMLRQMNLPGIKTGLGLVTEKGTVYTLRHADKPAPFIPPHHKTDPTASTPQTSETHSDDQRIAQYR